MYSQDTYYLNFYKLPSLHNFRELLMKHTGEHDYLDFKMDWSDFAKMAKHILAMGNSGGGCIVVGMQQQGANKFKPVGVCNPMDKAEISDCIKKYLPSNMEYTIYDFLFPKNYDIKELQGLGFQVIRVDSNIHEIPYVSMGQKEKVLQINTIYIRKSTRSVPADYEQLQALINKRIATNMDTTLESELNELKLLYTQINKVRLKQQTQEKQEIIPKGYENNPYYPVESYDRFIANLIVRKKKYIENLICPKLKN